MFAMFGPKFKNKFILANKMIGGVFFKKYIYQLNKLLDQLQFLKVYNTI